MAMPYFFTIEGFSEQEVMEKLKREHPNYGDAMRVGTQEKSIPKFFGLVRRKKYVVSFVITDKHKAVQSAMNTIQEKNRKFSGERVDGRWAGGRSMVSNIAQVRRVVDIIESGQNPSAPFPKPAAQQLRPALRPERPDPAEYAGLSRPQGPASRQPAWRDSVQARPDQAMPDQAMPAEAMPAEAVPDQAMTDQAMRGQAGSMDVYAEDIPAGRTGPAGEDPAVTGSSRAREVPGSAARPGSAEAAFARKLRDHDMDEEVIGLIMREMTLSGSALPFPGEGMLRQRFKEAISRVVKFRQPLGLAESEKKIVLFAGPTGVGKTTTLVKLSAESFRNQIPLRFMTNDTYRVGATGQLESYTNILNAPLDIVNTCGEFNRKIAAAAERLIFVDTAGRSPRDDDRQAELRQFLEGLDRRDYSLETFLVLAMTTDRKDMEETAASFSFLNPSGVILTKTDESRWYGKIVNFLCKTGLQAAYFTTGQSVPEDIVPATPEALAGMILN